MLAIADDGDGMQAALDSTGLSIVRALVRDELGGELTLVDDPGLRAEVRFPARYEERTTMRILIAEDETIIRLDLREMLEKAGFDVCAEARDGEEAVTLARTIEPDLALLDVKMPKLDGIDAARRILEERPIPIVMVTAYGEDGARLARGRGRCVRLPREAVPGDGLCCPRSPPPAPATTSWPRCARRPTRSPRRSPPARRSSARRVS